MKPKVSRQVIARAVVVKLLAEPSRHTHIMQALAAFLLDNNMIDDVALLMNDIAHELYIQAGQLDVEVVSANALTSDARRSLETYLKDKTGAKQIVLSQSVDSDLVGGLIARTPDAELDASVRGTLQRLTALAS